MGAVVLRGQLGGNQGGSGHAAGRAGLILRAGCPRKACAYFPLLLPRTQPEEI